MKSEIYNDISSKGVLDITTMRKSVQKLLPHFNVSLQLRRTLVAETKYSTQVILKPAVEQDPDLLSYIS